MINMAKKPKYPKNPVRYLAQMVHELTGGGRALTEFMWEMMNGEIPDASARDRLEAAKYLTERGYGKAPQTIEISGTMQHEIGAGYDLSKLSDAELAQIATSLDRVRTAALPEPEDAEAVEIEVFPRASKELP
jgi:hypothetical protein